MRERWGGLSERVLTAARNCTCFRFKEKIAKTRENREVNISSADNNPRDFEMFDLGCNDSWSPTWHNLNVTNFTYFQISCFSKTRLQKFSCCSKKNLHNRVVSAVGDVIDVHSLTNTIIYSLSLSLSVRLD